MGKVIIKKQYQVYDACKNSGLVWLDKVPKNWEVQKLKYLTSINSSNLSENTDKDYLMKYIDIRCVNSNGSFNKIEDVLFENAPSRARRKIKTGSSIVATVRTYLKAIAYFRNPEENIIVSTGFAVLDPKQNLDSRYLYYALIGKQFIDSVIAYSTGVSYPAITPEQLGNLFLVYPNTETQQKIATYLDQKIVTIDALIEKKKKLIELLEEKRMGVISEAITRGINKKATMKNSGVDWIGDIPNGWTIKTLKSITEFVSRGSSPDYAENETKNKVLNQACVYWDGLHLKKIKYNIPCDINSKKGHLKKYDLVANSTGTGTLGRVALFDKDDTNFFADSHLTIIRMNRELIRPKFVLYLLQTNLYQGYIYASCVTGSTNQIELSKERLREVPFIYPSLDEQSDIIDYIEQKTKKIDQVLKKVQRSIDLLEEYKTSIITHVVMGKVKV